MNGWRFAIIAGTLLCLGLSSETALADSPPQGETERDIRAGKAPMPLTPDPAWWGAGVAALAVAGLLAFSRRQSTLPQVATPEMAPLEALTELELSMGRAFSGRGSVDRLSAILRLHLESLGVTPVCPLTSEELVDLAGQRSLLTPESQSMLVELLAWCDRSRFAGDEVNEKEMSRALTMARRFIVASGGGGGS